MQHKIRSSSRFISFILVLSLIPIWNTFSAPTSETSQLAHHEIERHATEQRDWRSVTNIPQVKAPFLPEVVHFPRPPRDDGHGNLRWTAQDDNGISEKLAISRNGNIIAIGYTLNDERLEVRNAFGGDTLFTFPVESGGSYVALSATGEIIAYSALDSVWVFRSNGHGAPILRASLDGFFAGPVAVSAEGDRLIATGIDPDGRVNRAWGFNIANGQRIWTIEVDAQETFGWYGATISTDGRTAVVNAKFHLWVINVANGNVIWDEPTYNTESAVLISDDSRILVTGSLSGRFRVFARDDGGYHELWHYTFSGAVSSWVTSVAVSRDGGTVAAGTLDFFNDHYEGRYALFDTYGNGQPVWISRPCADEIADLALSDDGAILGAVSWGDLDNERPDLFVHERHNREPLYSLSTAGSLTGVAISGNGGRLIAGGKATHNRVFGRGGQAHLIELGLIGGFAAGRVRDQRGQGIQGATVSAVNSPYSTVTDAQGNFILRIETDDPADFDIIAEKRGVGRRTMSTRITPDDTTSNVNFQIPDGLVGDPPVELRAAQGEQNHITLTWRGYNGRRIHQAGGNDPEVQSIIQTEQVTPEVSLGDSEDFQPLRDESDDANTINIYRSPLSGGPYTLVGTVDGNENIYTDRLSLYPQHEYYYRITAVFDEGESEYSDEAIGWLNDEFLIWNADLESFGQRPRLDGVINQAEWVGAEFRDISDVFGYDAPDSAGSVYAWIGFSDEDKRLYLAVRYRNLHQLEQSMGVGVYVDDNGDGAWSPRRDGTEGNYWGYWRDEAPLMIYRSLSGGPYSADPYFRFQEPTLAFGESNLGVEVEMSIPIGFHTPEEIAVFAPDKTIGLGLFAMERDEANSPIFDGWWPQDMLSIVSEPRQFASVRIPVSLRLPPIAPTGIAVSAEESGMAVAWNDPGVGIDSAANHNWDGIRVYRNNHVVGTANRGAEAYHDRDFRRWNADWGGWFEYSLAGYIMENGRPFEGPRSRSIGAYLGEEPQIETIRFDDGSPEALYVVAYDGVDNRFATRFAIEAGIESISTYWVEFYQRGGQPIDIWCTREDDNGRPAEGGTHYRYTPTSTEGMERFHFPGREQPLWEFDPDFGGAFWVVLNYLPTSPAAPAIGIDGSVVDEDRNLYYTAANGWRSFPLGQPMIRVGVGDTFNEAPPETEPPRSFEVLGNYPNPFNGKTFISVQLPVASPVDVTLTDLQGRVVMSINKPELSAGKHTIALEADYLSTGMYIATVQAGGENRRIALQLLK